MREILFRGKTFKPCPESETVKADYWVYGGVSQKPGAYSNIYSKKNGKWMNDSFVVLTETLGQYTGLEDKNGTQIFEGDILKAYYDDKSPKDVTFSVVVWLENGWKLQPAGCSQYDDLDSFAQEYNEVVGNIFDSPELLEGN